MLPAGTPAIVKRPPIAVRAPRIPGPSVTPTGATDTCTSAMPACPAESVTTPVIDPAPCWASASPAHRSNASGNPVKHLRYRLDIDPPVGLSEPPIVPCETSIDHVDDVFRLAHPMALA